MASPNSDSRWTWLGFGLIGIFVVIGFFLMWYAFRDLLGGGTSSPTATVAVAQVRTSVPTRLPATATATPAPTDTPLPPTDTSVPATDTPAPVATQAQTTGNLEIVQGINVRSGPGTVYSILGGVNAGNRVNATGRDAAAQWYVIDYNGQAGWVAAQFVRYSGDTNALPVVAAPPAPTAPPAAPTSPPSGGGSGGFTGFTSRGVVGQAFNIQNPVVNAGQDIWFTFKVVNTNATTVRFGILGAKVVNGQIQPSWTEASMQPSGVLEHTDHLNITTPGTYPVQIAICWLPTRGECNSSLTSNWEPLTSIIQVTVR